MMRLVKVFSISFLLILAFLKVNAQDTIQSKYINEAYLRYFFPKLINKPVKQAFYEIEQKGYYLQYCNFLISKKMNVYGILVKFNSEVEIEFLFEDSFLRTRRNCKKRPCDNRKVRNAKITQINVKQNGKVFEMFDKIQINEH